MRLLKQKHFKIKHPDYDDPLNIEWRLDDQGNHSIVNHTHNISSPWFDYAACAYLSNYDIAVFSDHWTGSIPVEIPMNLCEFPSVSQLEVIDKTDEIQVVDYAPDANLESLETNVTPATAIKGE